MARKNKKAWIRIMEAGIAILILASVLVVAYSYHAPKEESYLDYIYNLQSRALKEVSMNNAIRAEVLNENEAAVFNFIKPIFPNNLNVSVRICDLNETSCSFLEIPQKNVFVEERIISSNLSEYDPKKIRLFVWETG